MIVMLEKNKGVVERNRNRRRQTDQGEDMDKKGRVALGLLSKGKVSKAVSRINSKGVASMADPEVVNQMAAKYPERKRELPAFVTNGQCVDNLRDQRESLLALEPDVSPGTGGFRAEYLIVMGELFENHEMELLERLGLMYLNGELPPWHRSIR